MNQEMRKILIREFKDSLTEQIKHCIDYIKIAEEINITDEQWFIEYENWLNKLSCIDHTVGVKDLPEVDLNKNILI